MPHNMPHNAPQYAINPTNPTTLSDLRSHYLRQLSAPLDGMWETFAEMGSHYAISEAGDDIGYCIINDENVLLQFFVKPGHDAESIFHQVFEELSIRGAVVTTSQNRYLSLCMDHQTSVEVNAITYNFDDDAEVQEVRFPAETEFRLIVESDLEVAVDFGAATLGADRGWLSRYYGEKVSGEELFGLWRGDILIAIGECRPSPTQTPYADVGMIVSTSQRGEGIATNILRQLTLLCRQRGLRPICSTEAGNVAARKSIKRAGFRSQHRILEVGFATDGK